MLNRLSDRTPPLLDYQQVMMTLAPLQEPLTLLLPPRQNNINVHTGQRRAFWASCANAPAVRGVSWWCPSFCSAACWCEKPGAISGP